MVGAHYEGEHSSAAPSHLIEESNGYSDRTLIAMVHSHPYCTGHVPNEFSVVDPTGQPTGDFSVAIQLKIPVYLAAPNGNLMKLHVISIAPASDGSYNVEYVRNVICGGLPSDNTIYDCRRQDIMKRRVIFAICLIGILLFVCWAGSRVLDLNQGSWQQKTNADTPTDGSISYVTLPGWKMYKGNVAITDYEKLPYLEEYALEGDVLTVCGDAYILLDPPTDTIMLPTASGWKIDLNAMYAKWRTAEGDIILLPDADISPVICIYEQDSGEIRSYLQQKFAEQGIVPLGIESFDVYYKGDAIHPNKQLRNVWDHHISDDPFAPAALLLDGDWSFHTLSMVYSNCDALQYEINIAVCDGLLFLENYNSGELMCLTVSKLES